MSKALVSPKPVASMNGANPKKQFASSPALIGLASEAYYSSISSLSIAPKEEYSFDEIFKLVAKMRICVVRRAGSDVDSQVSSIVDSSCRSIDLDPKTVATHFLTASPQCAGKMLDCVQRKGLPLIFLNGDCVGGLAELKRLEKSGFIAESLCPHELDLVVIVGGGTSENSVAEKLIEEAVLLKKRVALVEVVRQGRKERADARVAKEMVNQAALMRTSIEEARVNGWAVEADEGQTVSFCLDWQCVREGIALRKTEKRERLERVLELGKVQRFVASACHFSGSHELTVCPDKGLEQFQKDGLLKLNADRFVLVAKGDPKVLENVPGAKEFCISNEELFSMDHNPGKTLLFCETDSDPALLESAAILRALGNQVTIMSHTNKTSSQPDFYSFDPELVQFVKEKLRQNGVRFLMSVPTKFEQLRAATSDKSAVFRVYAMSSTLHNGPAEKGTDGCTPFLEEFNTVVVCIGNRSKLLQELLLDKNGIEFSAKAEKLDQQPMLPPNFYAIGDLLEESDQSREGNCRAARRLLRRLYEGELDSADQNSQMRTLLVPPLEYARFGLSEPEAQKKYGKEALSVSRDGNVAIKGAVRAKVVCLRQEQERVIGMDVIAPKASHILQGYALAVELGLRRRKLGQHSCKMMNGK